MSERTIPLPKISAARSERRAFIGGSDARTIMGDDEVALLRLWREKRGKVEPEDLSGNLVVQLGLVTEELNRRWYEANTGQVLTDIQRQIRHPVLRWMAATLDGRVEATQAVFEAKFMLPWAFSEEAAAEKYMPQLQHRCGWLQQGGLRSLPMPIRSISTSLSRLNGNSGAVSRAASPLASSALSHRSPGSRQCGLWT